MHFTVVRLVNLTLITVIFGERSAVCESMTEMFCRRNHNSLFFYKSIVMSALNQTKTKIQRDGPQYESEQPLYITYFSSSARIRSESHCIVCWKADERTEHQPTICVCWIIGQILHQHAAKMWDRAGRVGIWVTCQQLSPSQGHHKDMLTSQIQPR